MNRAALLLLVLLAPALAVAKKPKAGATPQPTGTPLEPIALEGKHFEFGRDGQGLFSGDVVARQGTFVLRAQELIASYSVRDRAILKASAEGGVTLSSDDRVSQAARAEWDNGTHTILLLGQPRMWDATGVVEGERILFHVDTGQVECFECSIDVDPEKARLERPPLVPPTPVPGD